MCLGGAWNGDSGSRWISRNAFLSDHKSYDITKGYRADDSYFSYARDFISNTLSLGDLKRAMMLWKLGEQIVHLSEWFAHMNRIRRHWQMLTLWPFRVWRMSCIPISVDCNIINFLYNHHYLNINLDIMMNSIHYYYHYLGWIVHIMTLDNLEQCPTSSADAGFYLTDIWLKSSKLPLFRNLLQIYNKLRMGLRPYWW